MVFINSLNDVTLTPRTANPVQNLLTASRARTNMSFQDAMNNNRIYQGNGLICQQRMCHAMTGCEDVNVCAARNRDWDRVVEFCGPIGSPAMAAGGAEWRLVPAQAHRQLLSSTEAATGMSVLPNPYNVAGMY